MVIDFETVNPLSNQQVTGYQDFGFSINVNQNLNRCSGNSSNWKQIQFSSEKKSSSIKFLFINKNQTRNTCKLAEALFITRRTEVLNKKTFCPISLMIFSIQIFKGQTSLLLKFSHVIQLRYSYTTFKSMSRIWNNFLCILYIHWHAKSH